MKYTTVAALAALMFAGTAEAQIWDTPSFLPPRPGDDVGIYVAWPDGADLALQGIWRQRGNLNLGVRVGYADYGADGVFLAGAETWGGILNAGADFPVDVTWTAGAGGAFGDGTLFSVPVGVSIGRTLVLSPLTVQVYGHPRLALVVFAVDNNTTTELEGMFDLGADLHLTRDWKIRLGFTLAGTDAFGIGAAYRFGRGVVVR